MSITPEVTAKTLTQLVATEIKVQMARADVRQSQLAREIGKTEQWLSVRLRGRQPIDVNDLALIAKGLHVGIHQLLPAPDEAARAADPSNTWRLLQPTEWPAIQMDRPRDNRPSGRPSVSRSPGTPASMTRTSLVSRSRRKSRD